MDNNNFADSYEYYDNHYQTYRQTHNITFNVININYQLKMSIVTIYTCLHCLQFTFES